MPTTTRQLAKIADVAEQTVRNYTRDYAELLSPQARGDVGARLFSDEDVRVFCSIATLRKENVPPAEVIRRIQNGDTYIDAKPQQATPNEPQGAQAASSAPQAIIISPRSIQTLVDVLRRSEQQSHKQLLWTHGVAFYLGMVTMGVMFYVVWLIVNGW